MDTIKAWALIVRLTVAEYLGLDPTESTRPKEVRASEEVEDGERMGMGKRNGDELVSFKVFSFLFRFKTRCSLIALLCK